MDIITKMCYNPIVFFCFVLFSKGWFWEALCREYCKNYIKFQMLFYVNFLNGDS